MPPISLAGRTFRVENRWWLPADAGDPWSLEAVRLPGTGSWLGLCNESYIEIEGYSGDLLNVRMGLNLDQSSWLYGPVLSVFEGEIPWP